MKNRPLHENLDTSFINLSALVKYLRRRQFVGQVRIELSGYEADIYLTADNQLQVREYDHIAGRIADGAEALQRILIRSREPGGIVSVYQAAAENEPAAPHEPALAAEQKTPPPSAPAAPVAEEPSAIKTGDSPQKANQNGAPKIETTARRDLPNEKIEVPSRAEKPPPAKTIFQNVPFEFSNRVEARARQSALSAEDREALFNLTGELLGTLDHALGMAKLEFPAAFQKACAEISADYPFLKTLGYGKGKIFCPDAPPNPKFFVAGVLEALRRILDRLAASPQHAEVYRYSVQRILALIHQRRPFYDKFAITKPLEKILGA